MTALVQFLNKKGSDGVILSAEGAKDLVLAAA